MSFTNNINGFPIIASFNHLRTELHSDSYHPQKSFQTQTKAWIGHKLCTVVCLPLNTVGVAAGLAGVAVTACTLGALKIAIFAATLGHIKPQFPTGVIYFGERGIHSACHLFRNPCEIIYNAGKVVQQGYRATRWVVKQLHLEGFFKEIFIKIGKMFDFIGDRIDKSLSKTIACEKQLQSKGEIPGLASLNRLAAQSRIDLSADARPLKTIAKHYAWSVIGIPTNATATIVAIMASILTTAAFIGKILLYASTNVHIPLPTYIRQSYHITGDAFGHTCLDIGSNIADSFVLIYKTSKALGVNKVVATVSDVLKFIPEAIFS